jgi:hypothetical protein
VVVHSHPEWFPALLFLQRPIGTHICGDSVVIVEGVQSIILAHPSTWWIGIKQEMYSRWLTGVHWQFWQELEMVRYASPRFQGHHDHEAAWKASEDPGGQSADFFPVGIALGKSTRPEGSVKMDVGTRTHLQQLCDGMLK